MQIFKLFLRLITFLVYRLFHSLMVLEKIIGTSAFFLILKDKLTYDSYSSDTFLEMVSDFIYGHHKNV